MQLEDIGTAGKDDLADFARAELGMELDLSKPVRSLRQEVRGAFELMSDGDEGEEPEAPTQAPDFLRHPVNGRVFPCTPMLLARGDMIPCDEDGKEL